MVASDMLSTDDAARRLGVHPSRVRALLAAGELQGVKLGGNWVVEADSIRRRLRGASPPGRLLEPGNAWGALCMASGAPAGWLTPDSRWRVRKLLDERGVAGLAPRLRRRAARERYAAHPGVLRQLSQRPDAVRTGVSAAAAVGLDLAGGNELDVYVSLGSRGELIDAYALEPAGIQGNLSLRVVNGSVWPFHAGVVPRAVVALDLAEEADSRSARVGREALAALDRESLWMVGGRSAA